MVVNSILTEYPKLLALCYTQLSLVNDYNLPIAEEEKRWFHAFLKGFSVNWNANDLVQNLNSASWIHFPQRYATWHQLIVSTSFIIMFTFAFSTVPYDSSPKN